MALGHGALGKRAIAHAQIIPAGTTLSFGLAQSQSLDNVDLVQHFVLSVDSISQSQQIENTDLVQKHVLAVDDLAQPQSATNVVLQVALTLTVHGIEQEILDHLFLVFMQVLKTTSV